MKTYKLLLLSTLLVPALAEAKTSKEYKDDLQKTFNLFDAANRFDLNAVDAAIKDGADVTAEFEFTYKRDVWPAAKTGKVPVLEIVTRDDAYWGTQRVPMIKKLIDAGARITKGGQKLWDIEKLDNSALRGAKQYYESKYQWVGCHTGDQGDSFGRGRCTTKCAQRGLVFKGTYDQNKEGGAGAGWCEPKNP